MVAHERPRIAQLELVWVGGLEVVPVAAELDVVEVRLHGGGVGHAQELVIEGRPKVCPEAGGELEGGEEVSEAGDDAGLRGCVLRLVVNSTAVGDVGVGAGPGRQLAPQRVAEVGVVPHARPRRPVGG